MAQDTYGRYTNTGRPVDDMGETTPVVELSESVRPWGKWLPAPYLPSTRFDVHKRANIVLSVGTPVALDTRGSLIPAGIPDGHVFSYGANDYLTGFTATLNPADGTAMLSTDNAYQTMHASLLNNGFASAVGVTSYNVYAHEGGTAFSTWPTYTPNYDNPVSYDQHNTMAQDLVAITCDYTLLVPYLEGKNLLAPNVKAFTSTTAADVAVLSDKAKSYAFAHDELYVGAAVSGSLPTGLELVYVSTRNGSGNDGAYDNATSDALILTSGATGVTFTNGHGGTAGSVVTFATLSAQGYSVAYDGDDPRQYVVFRNKAGTTISAWPAANSTYLPTLRSAMKPGEFVAAREGKFVKWDEHRMTDADRVGQILAIDTNVVNKSYLNHVKTAYERATTPSHQMPGFATRGVPYSIQLVTDGAYRLYVTSKKSDGSAMAGTPSAPTLRLMSINLLR